MTLGAPRGRNLSRERWEQKLVKLVNWAVSSNCNLSSSRRETLMDALLSAAAAIVGAPNAQFLALLLIGGLVGWSATKLSACSARRRSSRGFAALGGHGGMAGGRTRGSGRSGPALRGCGLDRRRDRRGAVLRRDAGRCLTPIDLPRTLPFAIDMPSLVREETLRS